ncbi:hypothetical protein Sjap_002396 [Stephania japonica]|uniref:Uncharacterized protein n=1 Tax=Stephania japonica TaxID=461633 RepID=A0AAP0PW28_9MAGN
MFIFDGQIFRGKEWNKGSNDCKGEKIPLLGPRYHAGLPGAAIVVNKVLSRIKKPVYLLEITTVLSQMRVEMHILRSTAETTRTPIAATGVSPACPIPGISFFLWPWMAQRDELKSRGDS